MMQTATRRKVRHDMTAFAGEPSDTIIHGVLFMYVRVLVRSERRTAMYTSCI